MSVEAVVTTKLRRITYHCDGESFDGALFLPEVATRVPVVLVVPAWEGRSEAQETVAIQLARHGYAAFCVDVYGTGTLVTPSDVTALGHELNAAKADWQIHVFGGTMHAFTNRNANSPQLGFQYNAPSTRRAWTALEIFLRESFEVQLSASPTTSLTDPPTTAAG
jgi:dienelactone hydrolase